MPPVAAAKKEKRRMPDLAGVPGEIVKLEGLVLEFGNRKTKVSPYDPLLDRLATAGAGMVLKFGDVRARVSIGVRAKKKAMVIQFAEQGGQLYVKYVGRLDEQTTGDRKLSVLRMVRRQGSTTAQRVTNALRDLGDTLIDTMMTVAIMDGYKKSGELIQEEASKLWKPNPGFRDSK